jgi:hypothetical protein
VKVFIRLCVTNWNKGAVTNAGGNKLVFVIGS